MPILDKLFGVGRLKRKREKLRKQVRELQQEISAARKEGESEKVSKLNSKRKHLMSRIRWYDERIEEKEEE